MDAIENLKDINWFDVFIGVVAFVVACQFLYKTFIEGIIQKFGIETKWMRKRREEHDLLMTNTQAIKDLAELHKRDMGTSNDHDTMIQKELSMFMEEVRNDIKQFTENRIHDREQSLEIQKELTDAQLAISNSIHEISEKIDAMQKNTNERFELSEEKMNKRVQSDIKERISQSYRHYNLSKKITRMELDALEDLISTYETYGGENSFVHSVVQKEMYTWEVIE